MDSNLTLSSHPIGIFDSGIGGLSVARKIRELLPNEDIIYVADSLHAPYGEKSDNYIFQRMDAVTKFLLTHEIKALVVACNTATTTAISKLRTRYLLPIIGIEPGIKPASLSTHTGIIGVLATSRTLQTNSFTALTKRFANNIKIEIQPCPGLVTKIEALDFDSTQTINLLEQYISPLLAKGADTIVLGCTHYNHLSELIAKIAGENVAIIKTDTAVAKEVVRRLSAIKLLTSRDHSGTEKFWTSGPLAIYQQQIERLWGKQSQYYHWSG
ncbi:glutamate racemase [Nitrosomonas stercoris]|uniref:Glutamate racemase n=1 Tax=Nitrosomonas stercoris TaxID=1444684 RepID=A0A4Y1YQ07_9PROT|nr:glutamate racemase [Nitrosomonas stercoris]